MERGSRDSGAEAIVVVAHGEQLGKRVVLHPRQPIFIGSAAQNDLVLAADWGVAARHARIERRAGAWWIVSLDADASLRVRSRIGTRSVSVASCSCSRRQPAATSRRSTTRRSTAS